MSLARTAGRSPAMGIHGALYRVLLRTARRVDAKSGALGTPDAAALLTSARRLAANDSALSALIAAAEEESAPAATAKLMQLASLYSSAEEEEESVGSSAATASASTRDGVGRLSALLARAFRAPAAAPSEIDARIDAGFALMRAASIVETAGLCSAELRAIFDAEEGASAEMTSARSLEAMEDAALVISALGKSRDAARRGTSARERLDRLARVVETHLDSAGTDGTLAGVLSDSGGDCDFERLRVINRVLWEEEELRGAEETEYHSPSSTHLDEVLRARVGIPLSLSLVFGAVARRVGLAVSGTAFPAHFLLHAQLRLPHPNSSSLTANGIPGVRTFGIYQASFPGHGTELVRVSAVAMPFAEWEEECGDTVAATLREVKAAAIERAGGEDTAYGGDSILVMATKITGDVNIPAGELSWACALACDSLEDGTKLVTSAHSLRELLLATGAHAAHTAPPSTALLESLTEGDEIENENEGVEEVVAAEVEAARPGVIQVAGVGFVDPRLHPCEIRIPFPGSTVEANAARALGASENIEIFLSGDSAALTFRPLAPDVSAAMGDDEGSEAGCERATVYVDPYHRGRVLTAEECSLSLRATELSATERLRALEPTPAREVIKRMLRNLIVAMRVAEDEGATSFEDAESAADVGGGVITKGFGRSGNANRIDARWQWERILASL